MVPDSSFSCALRRFAALIGESVSFSVPRNLPASSHSATWFSSLCCSIMSGVWKRGRVNISSKQIAALLARTASSCSGCLLPTMSTMAPCGATRSPIAAQCSSTSLELAPDDALVDQMEFAVAAGRRDIAGVIDRVAGLEERDLRADRGDAARRVPAEHARRGMGRFPLFGVDGIDRHGLDFDEQIATGG